MPYMIYTAQSDILVGSDVTDSDDNHLELSEPIRIHERVGALPLMHPGDEPKYHTSYRVTPMCLVHGDMSKVTVAIDRSTVRYVVKITDAMYEAIKQHPVEYMKPPGTQLVQGVRVAPPSDFDPRVTR